jgi:hypothetical protein
VGRIKPPPFNSAVVLVSCLNVDEGCLLPLSMVVLVDVPRIEPFLSKIHYFIFIPCPASGGLGTNIEQNG